MKLLTIRYFTYTIVSSSGLNSNAAKALPIPAPPTVCPFITGPSSVKLDGTVTHLTGITLIGVRSCVAGVPTTALKWYVDGNYIGTGTSAYYKFPCDGNLYQSFEVKLVAQLSNGLHGSIIKNYKGCSPTG